MTTTTQAAGRVPGAAVSPPGLFWSALAVTSASPFFRFGITGLAEEWAWPEFGHGPVIPVLSFHMFLRETKAPPPAGGSVADRWPGRGTFSLAAREVDLRPTRLGRVTLNRAVIRRGLERRPVPCWRKGRGRRLTGDVAILPGEPEAEAHARARRFPRAAVERLRHFVSE